MTGIMDAQTEAEAEAAERRFEADLQLALERSRHEAAGWRTVKSNKKRPACLMSLSDTSGDDSEEDAELQRVLERSPR